MKVTIEMSHQRGNTNSHLKFHPATASQTEWGQTIYKFHEGLLVQLGSPTADSEHALAPEDGPEQPALPDPDKERIAELENILEGVRGQLDIATAKEKEVRTELARLQQRQKAIDEERELSGDKVATPVPQSPVTQTPSGKPKPADNKPADKKDDKPADKK